MHTHYSNAPAVCRAIIVVLALLVWGIGLETIKARQVDLVYLGQQHMILVFSRCSLPCWSVFQRYC
jgi:osmoprotectant transport system permease protein